jgi:hypothetical protein
VSLELIRLFIFGRGVWPSRGVTAVSYLSTPPSRRDLLYLSTLLVRTIVAEVLM